MTEVLLRKPIDIYAFAFGYFSSFVSDKIHRPLPIAIAGPSGVGKGTLIERLMTEFPDAFGLSVSHTTRAPRVGEIPGFHYHFSTRAEMERGIAHNEFLESAKVHDNYYGTSKKAVEDVVKLGKICILDIDVQGCESVKKSGMPCRFVFITPPSEEELRRRLTARGTETPEKIEIRMQTSKKELEYTKREGFFDHIIINDDFETAYGELKAVIKEDIDARNNFLK